MKSFLLCWLIAAVILALIGAMAVFIQWLNTAAPEWVELLVGLLFGSLVLGGVIWLWLTC